MVRHLLHGIFLIALLSILGLLLWAPPPTGVIGTEQQGYDCFQKILELYSASREGRSLIRDFSEEEMNAYLAVRVDDAGTGEQARAMALELEGINLSFTDDLFIAHIATRWNFLSIAYRISGTPHIEDRVVNVRLHQVQIGRLPIPEPLRESFASRMLPIIRALEEEWFVLENMTRIGLRPGQCRLMVGP